MPSLYRYQLEGVEWLAARPHAGLFDDQGLGKTATSIVAADRVKARRVLVVCPTAVTHNWKREVAMWSPRRRVQVVSRGDEAVRKDCDVVVVSHGMLLTKMFDAVFADSWDLILVDEVHFFRNPNAKRTRKMFLGAAALARQAPRCWLLSGTPMPNDPSELWAMLAGIAPERLRDGTTKKLLSWAQFREHFCDVQPVLKRVAKHVNGVEKVEMVKIAERVVAAKNTVELKQRLKGFALRRMKKDELNLPPVRTGMVSLTSEVEANLDVDVLTDDLIEEVQKAPSFSKWRHECGVAKIEPTVSVLAGDLESGMNKVVVFAHHLDVVAGIRAGLESFGADTFTGSDSAAVRADKVARFQGDPSLRVLVCQINAAGFGITLTAASEVVMVEPSFVPGDNAQAVDRVVRIGQTRPVLVRWFLLDGSVDEKVMEILARKTAMIREIAL